MPHPDPGRPGETAVILAIEAYNLSIATEDRLEGVRAFNEKRTPRFQGR